MAYAQDIDPTILQAMMEDVESSPEAINMRRMQKRAEALRQQEVNAPTGGRMLGRVFAPDYAGILQGVVSGAKAGALESEADKVAAGVGQRSTQQRQKYLDALVRAMRRGGGGNVGMMPPTATPGIMPPTNTPGMGGGIDPYNRFMTPSGA